MFYYEDIAADVEANGRMSEKQEDILFTLALKQDELGRQSTNILFSKIKNDPMYQEMFKREYLTYQLFNYGGDGSHAICSLYVTLKGQRYAIMFGDEIDERREVDCAGRVKARLAEERAAEEAAKAAQE